MKIWKIQCKKCGSFYEDAPSQIVSYTRLQGNNPCQCWKNCSKGNLKIAALLQENGLSYQTEYQFSDCLSPKGNPLKFDFYVNNQYLIEYDGEQHYKPVAFHGDLDRAEKQFLLNQQYDELKNQYCKQHNIPLIRIPYTLYSKLTIDDLVINTSAYAF